MSGKCNDEKCSFWHYKSTCELSAEEIICDLVAYDLVVFDATPTMSSETKQKLLRSFTQQFITQYTGKMSSDEQLLLLWNQLKENRKSRKIPTNQCITFDERNWHSKKDYSPLISSEKQNKDSDAIAASAFKEKPSVYYLKKKKNLIPDSIYVDTFERYVITKICVISLMKTVSVSLTTSTL